jgi:hypothetical protein
LPADFTNQYGYVNVERATEFIMNDRASLDPNSKEYTYEVRRMPLNYEEATSSAIGNTTFPNQRLNKRRIYLATLPIDRKPYVTGFLDEDSNGKVSWNPDPLGIWKVSVLPYVDARNGINTQNRYKKIGPNIFAPVNQEFCFGYDPVRYGDKMPDDKSVSKCSIIVRKKFDYFGGGNENKYAALCNWRPYDGHDGHKECMKAAKFWGMKGMHERQVETVEEDFEAAGMGDMLMRNEKDGKRGIWTDANKRVTKGGVDMLMADMKIRDDGSDPIDDIPFEEMIIDRMEFDPSKTTKSDVTMSDIMLHYGLKQIHFTNQVESSNLNKQVRAILFPKYN